ncbi:ArsR/SmtB family transcription factor [Aeromicrobium sp. CF3.5]|uniref:ArsR/SmtB family transcription factor n=1 Tax=Aeromicrobium sp. CF3.5 TaxID=3373078 RepID=UPI003EE60637
MNETGAVFKALADPTRRSLLDSLRNNDGQTLGALCEHVEMTRQSATQHVDVLVRADLITVVRSGRHRLHFLNVTPIHEIGERWLADFDQPRLAVLSAIKQQAEENAVSSTRNSHSEHPTASVPTYVYVTYIRASAQQVWDALTDSDATALYWGHSNVSDWRAGSGWEHRRLDGSGTDAVGTVIVADPPTRLAITFEDSPEEDRQPSLVTFTIEAHEEIVRLTVTHENLPNEDMLRGISNGWPAVMANLKSLLETGAVLPQAPWTMGNAHA